MLPHEQTSTSLRLVGAWIMPIQLVTSHAATLSRWPMLVRMYRKTPQEGRHRFDTKTLQQSRLTSCIQRAWVVCCHLHSGENQGLILGEMHQAPGYSSVRHSPFICCTLPSAEMPQDDQTGSHRGTRHTHVRGAQQPVQRMMSRIGCGCTWATCSW